MAQTQVSGSGIKNNVITNNHLHSAANIANSKLADSGVTAGSYGSGSATLSLTINDKGIITAASTNSINTDLVADTTPQLGGDLDVQNRTILTNTTNASVNLKANGSGVVVIQAPSSSYDAVLQLNCSQNSHGVKIAAPPHSAAATYTLTLPSDIQNGKFLKVDSNGVTSWADPQLTASEILTLIKTVDGAGSGLNADVLDGLGSNQFLRSDAADSISGAITFTSGSSLDLSTNDIYLNARVINNQAGGADDGMYIGFNNSNSGLTRIYGGGATTGGLDVRGSGVNDVKINGNTVWHAGNDGSSSGLDSDLLDGQHGSYYSNYNNLSNKPTIPTNNNQLTNGAGYITSASLSGVSDGGNAASLDGIDSSQFVRSDQNDTITGQINFKYNDTTGDFKTIEVSGNGNHSGIVINPAASKQAHVRFYTNGTAKWQWRVPFHDSVGVNAEMRLYNWDTGSDVFQIKPDGTQQSRNIEPQSDSTYSLGTNSNRWANVYADTLYGDGSNLSGVASFPSGTKMLFVQSSAPTGWTKQTNYDNRALRLISGGSGGNGGGSNSFSTAFNSNRSTEGGSVSNHTLTISQMPNHSHSVPRGDVNWGSGSGNSLWGNNANRQTGTEGGGQSHNHSFTNPTVNLNVSYVDVIYASKD